MKKRSCCNAILMILMFTASAEILRADDYDLDISVDLPDESVEAATAPEREPPFSLYGYVVNFTDIGLEGADAGNVLYMRLKGDFSPGDALKFHFELSYRGSTGNQNSFALYDSYGLVPPAYEQSSFPYNDFVQSVNVDHLWGSASLGPLDLQFGKLPIAWGTGYIFNPTAKTASAAFMDSVTEETPGTISIEPTVQLMPMLSLQGYLAFQEKNHGLTASLGDGAFDNLPFGMRFQAVAGSFDLSAGFMKEVIKTDTAYIRNYYSTFDFAGALWNFGVYGEASLKFPGGGTKLSLDYGGYDFFSMLEFCAGFDYTIPGLDIMTRAEYYHNGAGAASVSDYDLARILSGELAMQGREYLFLYMERIFFNYLTLSAGGLINLSDGSAAFFPQVSYDVFSNFTVTLGGYIFAGATQTEFGGEYASPTIDLTDPSVFAKLKLSF